MVSKGRGDDSEAFFGKIYKYFLLASWLGQPYGQDARTKPMIGRTFYGHAQFMYKYKN